MTVCHGVSQNWSRCPLCHPPPSSSPRNAQSECCQKYSQTPEFEEEPLWFPGRSSKPLPIAELTCAWGVQHCGSWDLPRLWCSHRPPLSSQFLLKVLPLEILISLKYILGSYRMRCLDPFLGLSWQSLAMVLSHEIQPQWGTWCMPWGASQRGWTIDQWLSMATDIVPRCCGQSREVDERNSSSRRRSEVFLR